MSNTKGAGPYADYAQKDTIVLISQPQSQSCAVMGGIMAARMEHIGVKGIVVDGRVRDLESLADAGLPIWSRGTSIIGAGGEAKFHAYNVPIEVGNVTVYPGDLVMIDPHSVGIVVIPSGRLDEVLDMLPELVKADERVIADVKNGVSVKEAFRRHRNT